MRAGPNTYGYVYQNPLSFVDSLGLAAECTCVATGIVGGGGAIVNGVQPDKVCSYKCTCQGLDCNGQPDGKIKKFTVEVISTAYEKTARDISKRCLGQRLTSEMVDAASRGETLDPYVPFDFRTDIRHSEEVLEAYENIGMQPPEAAPHPICQASPQLCGLVDQQF